MSGGGSCWGRSGGPGASQRGALSPSPGLEAHRAGKPASEGPARGRRGRSGTGLVATFSAPGPRVEAQNKEERDEPCWGQRPHRVEARGGSWRFVDPGPSHPHGLSRLLSWPLPGAGGVFSGGQDCHKAKVRSRSALRPPGHLQPEQEGGAGQVQLSKPTLSCGPPVVPRSPCRAEQTGPATKAAPEKTEGRDLHPLAVCRPQLKSQCF